jgi:hypothetical protein
VRPAELFDGYAPDLDGNVHLGDALLPGPAETIQRLRDEDFVVTRQPEQAQVVVRFDREFDYAKLNAGYRGATGILVMTGDITGDVAAGAGGKPDYVLAGIHELLPTRYAEVSS